MKFLKSEYKDICAVFQRRGIPESDYSFRKKRGQLFIEMDNKEMPFCYYRYTRSELNATGQFIDMTSYFVGTRKEIEVEEWSEVLAWIDKWI